MNSQAHPSNVMSAEAERPALPRYVLITPARNEADFIEQTIKSVVSQKVLPVKWVIVSDGSTDGTDEIVQKYMKDHPWIELLRMPERRERHFAGKVQAFNEGYARTAGLDFDVVGSVDADISFDSDYFQFLLGKLAENPKLGLVGSSFKDIQNFTYDYRFVSIQHVTGCCMLFRRTCYEQIGGYVSSRVGAVDSIANISARMSGWETRTFVETSYLHHRPFGTASNSKLKSRFKDGSKDYAVGSHPIWMIVRGVYQMSKKPYFLGGLALLSGYFTCALRHPERPVSKEFVRFHRREQMQRLTRYFSR